MTDRDLFVTADLYEEQNRNAVSRSDLAAKSPISPFIPLYTGHICSVWSGTSGSKERLRWSRDRSQGGRGQAQRLLRAAATGREERHRSPDGNQSSGFAGRDDTLRQRETDCRHARCRITKLQRRVSPPDLYTLCVKNLANTVPFYSTILA